MPGIGEINMIFLRTFAGKESANKISRTQPRDAQMGNRAFLYALTQDAEIVSGLLDRKIIALRIGQRHIDDRAPAAAADLDIKGPRPSIDARPIRRFADV